MDDYKFSEKEKEDERVLKENLFGAFKAMHPSLYEQLDKLAKTRNDNVQPSFSLVESGTGGMNA